MYQPIDIFDPAIYQGVRRPHLEAEPLPHLCYTSSGFFDAEMETIFLTQWIFSGRGDQIPRAGDYMTAAVAGTPLVMVRDRNIGSLPHALRAQSHAGAPTLHRDGEPRWVVRSCTRRTPGRKPF